MSGGAELVKAAVDISGLNDYNGHFEELGGGEVNETFLLKGAAENYILRVTKVPGRDTLVKEAHALGLVQLPGVPRQVFFDPTRPIEGRYWILESQVEGSVVERLSPAQFQSLGDLLSHVHQIKDPENKPLHLWAQFLQSCRYFGNEAALLDHPDEQLRGHILSLQTRTQAEQPKFSVVSTRLIHGDATSSNILANGDSVSLVDWEFASFSDPMREFSAMYYEDIETNRGKWKIHVALAEKQALFTGYQEAGGEIDEDRIRFWMDFDKTTTAIFLYWKLNQSGQILVDEERQQNQFDFNQLLTSLASK